MTNRKGFTLIELLIVVVIIGILAAIAIPKFANTKDKAKIASMKSDLRNLVSAQEGHFADFATYATTIQAAGAPTAANITFQGTTGNTVVIGAANAAGFNATVTNASLSQAMTCGVFVGTAAAPNAAVTQEGAPVCY
jgi:prepilin-type N-terminal cleavage/methylation domain-containing protein